MTDSLNDAQKAAMTRISEAANEELSGFLPAAEDHAAAPQWREQYRARATAHLDSDPKCPAREIRRRALLDLAQGSPDYASHVLHSHGSSPAR